MNCYRLLVVLMLSIFSCIESMDFRRLAPLGSNTPPMSLPSVNALLSGPLMSKETEAMCPHSIAPIHVHATEPILPTVNRLLAGTIVACEEEAYHAHIYSRQQLEMKQASVVGKRTPYERPRIEASVTSQQRQTNEQDVMLFIDARFTPEGKYISDGKNIPSFQALARKKSGPHEKQIDNTNFSASVSHAQRSPKRSKSTRKATPINRPINVEDDQSKSYVGPIFMTTSSSTQAYHNGRMVAVKPYNKQ